MTSPFLTVLVLAVLWLIVVVPMVVRRNDTRAGERSIARFGSAMRALAARRAVPAHPDDVPTVLPRSGAAPAAISVPVSGRRPIPAARESAMYPPDRHEMSEARRQMLARRRRSLAVLGAGSAVFLLAGLVAGGTAVWTLALLFIAGLAGYVWFLRSQALRDRDRREARLVRAHAQRAARGHDLTAPPVRRAPGMGTLARELPDSVVRIDDDDVQLSHIDTVDLTGLYREEDDVPMRRAG
jgi:hypothetical protein